VLEKPPADNFSTEIEERLSPKQVPRLYRQAGYEWALAHRRNSSTLRGRTALGGAIPFVDRAGFCVRGGGVAIRALLL